MLSYFTNNFSTNDSLVRLIVSIAFSITTVIIVFCSLLNYQGLKYSLLKAPYEQFHCNNLVVTLNLPNSEVCCDTAHGDSWLCIASLDTIGRVFSSLYAWMIPLAVAVTTLIVDLVQINVFQCSNILSPVEIQSTVLLSFLKNQSASKLSQSLAVLLVFFRKVLIVFGIILFRVVRSVGFYSS
jgi:hypothetical protein